MTEANGKTKELIREIMREVLQEFPYVPQETHFRHHEYIDELIEEHKKRIAMETEISKARRDMYWSVAKAVAQYSVLGLIGALVYYIQHGQWSWPTN